MSLKTMKGAMMPPMSLRAEHTITPRFLENTENTSPLTQGSAMPSPAGSGQRLSHGRDQEESGDTGLGGHSGLEFELV